MRTLALDTMIAAYLLDPAEARYAIGELSGALRVGLGWPTTGASLEGQLDFGGDAVPDGQAAARCRGSP